MSAGRSQAEIRNPLLALPAWRELQELPPDVRAALRRALRALSDDARARAETSWRKHKAPMAAYWKAAAVYANHAQRSLRDRP